VLGVRTSNLLNFCFAKLKQEEFLTNMNKNKNKNKKFGFYKGSKLFSITLISFSALLCAGLLYAANMYYDIDAGKIIVDQVQRVIQNLEVVGTSYLGDGGTTNYAQISTTGDISFIGGADLITKAAAGDADDLTVSVTGGYNASLILSSSGTGADALTLGTSAGGIDITVAGAAAGEDLDLLSNTSINITATETAADAIVLTSSGGLDISAVDDIDMILTSATDGEDFTIQLAGATNSSLILSSAGTSTDALQILATAGGIDILASGAAAGEDIDIIATGSSVNINSTENVADSIVISSTNGGIDITTNSAEDLDISASGGLNLSSSEAVDGAITISTSNAAGQIYISSADTTADAIELDSSGGFDLVTTGAAGGAGDIVLHSDLASISITADEAITNAIVLYASAVAGGIDIDAGTGGINMKSTGAVAGNAITVETTDGGITLIAAGVTNGDLVFTVGDNYTLTVTGDASSIITGTYNIDATGVVTIDSDGNLVMGGSEISITSDGGNVTIDTGSGTLQVPSGRISVKDGAVLTEPGQLVLREMIPIFGFDLPAQTASTSYVTFSRTLENYPFQAALSSTTRVHKLVFRYSASTSAAVDLRIYNVDDSTTTDSYTLPVPGSNDIDKGNAYVATTTIPSSISSHKDWRVDIKTPDISSTVRIFQIFLAAYDQLP